MAPSPLAEATRLTGRCRTFPAASTPRLACLNQQRGRPGGRVRVAAGKAREPGKVAPPRLSTFPQPRLSTRMQGVEQRLCSIPPQTYAQVVILAGREAAGEHK